MQRLCLCYTPGVLKHGSALCCSICTCERFMIVNMRLQSYGVKIVNVHFQASYDCKRTLGFKAWLRFPPPVASALSTFRPAAGDYFRHGCRLKPTPSSSSSGSSNPPYYNHHLHVLSFKIHLSIIILLVGLKST